ncbi:MAG: hypothetical protein WCR67_04670 [Bacilli bacterium]
MVIIKLFGMDIYQAIPESKKLHARLVKLYDIPDNELEINAEEGFIIHAGHEQTSFRLDVTIKAPEQYEEMENEVKDTILDALKDVSVHFHLIFEYFNPEHEYTILDDSYPLYLTDDNTVEAEEEGHNHVDEEEHEDDEEEYDEPYMGDIITEFDEYVKKHPEATNKEIYEVLAGIRDEVTAKHQQEKAEEKE